MSNRKCVFCDRPAGSGEHVFPDWLRKLYKNVVATIVIEQENGVKRVYHKKIFSDKIRSVCGDCNTGWMSSIEGRVSGFLGGMVRATTEGIPLNEERQRALAIWAQKTLLVAESSFPATQRNASVKMFHDFYKSQDILPCSITFISFNSGEMDSSGRYAGANMYTLKELKIPPNDEAFFRQEMAAGRRFIVGTIKLGHVNLHTIASDIDGIDFDGHSPYGPAIQMIAPNVVFPVVNWPTTAPTELFGECEGIHQSLAQGFSAQRHI